LEPLGIANKYCWGKTIIKQNPVIKRLKLSDCSCSPTIYDYYSHVSMSYSKLSSQIPLHKITNID